IVDDGSTDTTTSVIKQNFKDARIQLRNNNVNRGANYCRNQGLEIAKGDYVIFLDADDVLMPHCVKNRVAKAKESNRPLCVFSMGVFKNKIGDAQDSYWKLDSKFPLRDFL